MPFGKYALLSGRARIGGQQVGVVLHEELAHHRRAEQEGAELLHRTSLRATGYQARPSSRSGDGAWYLAEVAVGHVFDLVVIVQKITGRSALRRSS